LLHGSTYSGPIYAGPYGAIPYYAPPVIGTVPMYPTYQEYHVAMPQPLDMRIHGEHVPAQDSLRPEAPSNLEVHLKRPTEDSAQPLEDVTNSEIPEQKNRPQKIARYEIMLRPLPFDLSIRDIKDVVYKIAHVKNVSLPMNQETPEYREYQRCRGKKNGKRTKFTGQVPNRGFCFVEFKELEGAEQALAEFTKPGAGAKFFNAPEMKASWSNNADEQKLLYRKKKLEKEEEERKRKQSARKARASPKSKKHKPRNGRKVANKRIRKPTAK